MRAVTSTHLEAVTPKVGYPVRCPVVHGLLRSSCAALTKHPSHSFIHSASIVVSELQASASTATPISEPLSTNFFAPFSAQLPSIQHLTVSGRGVTTSAELSHCQALGRSTLAWPSAPLLGFTRHERVEGDGINSWILLSFLYDLSHSSKPSLMLRAA